MSKFGDFDDNLTSYTFSIISKGNSIDNIIISKLVYPNILDNNDEKILRKYASALDLAYILFKNENF